MKKYFFLMATIAIMVLFLSCERQEYIEPADTEGPQITGVPLDDGAIEIQVTTDQKKSANSGDTILTEKWLKTTYQAIAKKVVIAGWQWTFAENNTKADGATVPFWHGLDPGQITTVTLIGIEANGVSHSASVKVKIVYSLDGLPGMVLVSKTSAAGGTWSYVIAAHKKGMAGVKGDYGFTGTIVTPAWTITKVAAADTNYNLVNNVLVAAGSGNIGKYIAIKYTTYPSDYELHVGHIKDGVLIFGSFWGWFNDGKYTQNLDGTLAARSVANLLGTSGDDGSNPIIRQVIGDSTVVIYTKYIAAFTKGFIQMQNADGTWKEPVAQTAVTNYPNWGKLEIKYRNFPIKDLLVFRFGPDVTNPSVFSANMSSSTYWDTTFQYLQIKYVPLGS